MLDKRTISTLKNIERQGCLCVHPLFVWNLNDFHAWNLNDFHAELSKSWVDNAVLQENSCQNLESSEYLCSACSLATQLNEGDTEQLQKKNSFSFLL